MNPRNMMNHSQVGQGIGIPSRTNSMSSSGLGSPNRSSPSIICMPKQQPSRQPFTVNRYDKFRMIYPMLYEGHSITQRASVFIPLYSYARYFSDQEVEHISKCTSGR